MKKTTLDGQQRSILHQVANGWGRGGIAVDNIGKLTVLFVSSLKRTLSKNSFVVWCGMVSVLVEGVRCGVWVWVCVCLIFTVVHCQEKTVLKQNSVCVNVWNSIRGMFFCFLFLFFPRSHQKKLAPLEPIKVPSMCAD